MAHAPQWKHSDAFPHPPYLAAPAQYPEQPVVFTNSDSMAGQQQQGRPEHVAEAFAKTQATSQPYPPQYDLKPPKRDLQGDIICLEGQPTKAYAMVDSWRSYREDSNTLSNQYTHYAPNPQATEFAPTYQTTPTTQPQSSFFTPYQPLRSVYTYARYQGYRVEKHQFDRTYHRISNGAYEKAVQQQNYDREGTSRHIGPRANRNSYSAAAPQADLSAQSTPRHRYPVRSKQRDNDGDESSPRATYGAQHTVQHGFHVRSRQQDSVGGSSTPWTSDVPLPSIEGGSNSVSTAQANFQSFRNFQARQITPRRTRERTEERTVSPPPAPEATEAYISKAKLPPVKGSTPRKLLVILDLNGTLLARPQLRNPTVFITRPGVDFLLQYLFDNHIVMIWTSMHMKNARPIVSQLLDKVQIGELAAFWARDKLELSQAQLHAKVQVYKKLDQVFADEKIQSAYPVDENGPGGWDQSNAILVDDSNLKALAQPHNLLQIPEFKAQIPKQPKVLETWRRNQKSILCSVILKLEELKYQTDVSRLILRWQTGAAEVPREPRKAAVVEEKQKSAEPAQLTTPGSLKSTDAPEDLEQKQALPTRSKAAVREEEECKTTRSESEIPESVWADLLAGR